MNPFKYLILCAGLACATGVQAQEIIEQEYHPNGRVRSTRYTDGRVERFLNYYESGRVREIGAFRDGRRDGVWQQFTEDGAVLAKATFVNGERQGTWEFRDPANVLKVRLQYADGRLATGEQFNEQGELIAQRTY